MDAAKRFLAEAVIRAIRSAAWRYRIELSTRVTVLSAQIYVAARLAHYVIYATGIPVVRTLAFLAGACATLAIAMALLDGAA